MLSTSARPDSPEQARRRRALIGLVRIGQFRGVTPRLMGQLVHRDRLADTALAAELAAMAQRVGKQAYLRQQQAILSRSDYRPDLPRLRLPAHVAVGDADRMTPPDRSMEIAAAIPGAKLHILARCGHMAPLERPERVSALMRNWIGAITATDETRRSDNPAARKRT